MIRQDSIKPGSLPLVIDNITRFVDIDNLNRRIFDQLSKMPSKTFQVYESLVTDKDLPTVDRVKNNRISSFLRRKSSIKGFQPKYEDEIEDRTVQYSLTLFSRNRMNCMNFDMIRVEVTVQVSP